MAYTIEVISKTSNSLTVSIDTTYPASDYSQYAWYLNDNWVEQTTSRTYTFTNLSPNTTYTVGFRAYYVGGSGGPAGWYPVSGPSNTTETTSPPPRPSNFSWVYSNVTNQAFQQGQPADYAIDHRDWNALGQKINEFRVYKGLSPITFTQVSKDTFVSATLFNQLRNAIMTLNPPNPPVGVKTQGSPIAAADINSLRYSLNSVP